MAAFINEHFVPLHAHIKEHPAWFHRFNAVWTPTVLVMDGEGTERVRIEGYLSRPEFQAQLEMALGRIAFLHKRWPEAEQHYDTVVRQFPQTKSAAEALYWRAVSHYKATQDHTVLGAVAQELAKEHPESIWTEKALPWRG